MRALRRAPSSRTPRSLFWPLALALLLATAGRAQATARDLDRGLRTGDNLTSGFGQYHPQGPGCPRRFWEADRPGRRRPGDRGHLGIPAVFQPEPCPPGIFPSSARVDCGFVAVPENRARPTGRKITVAAAVVHAPSSHPKRDPIVFLDGGPSFGAISSFAVDCYFAGADTPATAT
jgi:hypothetical protein